MSFSQTNQPCLLNLPDILSKHLNRAKYSHYICLQIAISIGSFNDFSQCLNCTKGKVVSKVNMLNFPNIYTLKHDDNIF